MIEAIIFDMDGLLIDSEPLWHEAEIEAFGRVGLHLTREDCLETTGMRVDEVVDYRYRRHPWEGMSKEEMADEITGEVVRLIRQKGELKTGAAQAVRRVKDWEVRIALASSSAYRIIDAVLEKFDLRREFEVIHSAQDEPYGKPHPAVYLSTAGLLSVAPQACLALEDSLAGVISAKAARMFCIAVPEKADKRFVLADRQLNSLEEFTRGVWQGLFPE